MELSDRQHAELVGGGSTDLHYHPLSATHSLREQLENIANIVDTAVDYTASLDDDFIVANSVAGDITVTLPAGKGQKEYVISKASSLNTVTVAFSNSEACYGQTTLSIMSLGDVIRLKFHLGIWITI